MATKDKMQGVLQRALQKALDTLGQEHERTRAAEAEELHNALVDVIAEHDASMESRVFVLIALLFQLLMAYYQEMAGVVQLTDKPPLRKAKTEE